MAEETNKNVKEEPAEKETKKKCGEKKNTECDKKLKNEVEKLNKKLEENEKELAELNDKYMRMIAEYDNFRRRTAKEKEGIYTDAYFEAVGGILPIIDNVERAASFGESDKVSEGISLILKSFNDLLTKLSITAFGEEGDKFDPNIHNAVVHVEDDSLEENVVVQVFQKGYRKDDRILRHAMVKVAN